MIRANVRCLTGLTFLLATAEAFASSQQPDPAAVASWNLAVRNSSQTAPSSQQPQGQSSPIEPRGNLNDQQHPAPRPGNQTLDPKYLGFIPIPNTPLIIKFNAKPRVDLTVDNRNSGDNTRFVTAKIPVSDDPQHGGGAQFNINAKGTQLSVDVRAPGVDGSPRFYYQNDFFGAGPGEFPYRVRQLYGQVYDIIVGMTFSVFEDPDVWPDTVDYEGPNSATFARRPLARYMLALSPEWQMNFGLEQPGSEVDTSIDPAAKSVNHAPDVGVNVRWEGDKVGHVQLAAIFRDIAVRGPVTGSQSAFGWGVNLSGVFTLAGKDSLQAQLTYGEGIFRYCNDDFVNNDAAFDGTGDLKPIPYFGAMVGLTHHWSEEWRSTASYGYVHLRNQVSQDPTAYHLTHYGSLNLVLQVRKRLSIGLEGLYGLKEDNAERRGDVFRVQFGLLYSLMD
jgi:outer membrane DcaP-like protein